MPLGIPLALYLKACKPLLYLAFWASMMLQSVQTVQIVQQHGQTLMWNTSRANWANMNISKASHMASPAAWFFSLVMPRLSRARGGKNRHFCGPCSAVQDTWDAHETIYCHRKSQLMGIWLVFGKSIVWNLGDFSLKYASSENVFATTSFSYPLIVSYCLLSHVLDVVHVGAWSISWSIPLFLPLAQNCCRKLASRNSEYQLESYQPELVIYLVFLM